MPKTLQDYLTTATQKASADLAAALLRLPEDKRGWSPGEKSRAALDQVAECAILNEYTAELIQTRTWQADWFADFPATLPPSRTSPTRRWPTRFSCLGGRWCWPRSWRALIGT